MKSSAGESGYYRDSQGYSGKCKGGYPAVQSQVWGDMESDEEKYDCG